MSARSAQVSLGQTSTSRARLAALAAVLALVALPLTLAARGPGVFPADIAIARAVQAPDWRWLDPLAWAMTEIGRSWPGETVLATLFVLLLAARGRRREALFVALAAVAGSLNVLTKLVVASPRPTPDLVRVVEAANGYGFPSGHAFGATLFYGALAVVMPSLVPRRAWSGILRVACVLMVALIGWSRIRLGAHWPSDVLGGWLWGGAMLALLAAWLPVVLGLARAGGGPGPGAPDALSG